MLTKLTKCQYDIKTSTVRFERNHFPTGTCELCVKARPENNACWQHGGCIALAIPRIGNIEARFSFDYCIDHIFVHQQFLACYLVR
jgi:hypothetical protein